jgi:hypothetical protein
LNKTFVINLLQYGYIGLYILEHFKKIFFASFTPVKDIVSHYSKQN